MVQQTRMVTGIDTLMITVGDMDRAVRFYRDVLGFPVKSQSPGWSAIDIQGTVLGLHPSMSHSGQVTATEAAGRGIGAGNFVLGLRVRDIREFRAHLERNGVTVTRDFHEIPGGLLLDFTDPDGNWLEAVERGAKK